ncbi:hypothetical protein V5E38_07770 [Rossellomorea sp. GAMAL-10_SWC]
MRHINKYIKIIMIFILAITLSACNAKEAVSVKLGKTKLTIIKYVETGKTSKLADKKDTKKVYEIIEDLDEPLKKNNSGFQQMETTHALVFVYGKDNTDNYNMWIVPPDNKRKKLSVIVQKQDYKYYKLSHKDAKTMFDIVSK